MATDIQRPRTDPAHADVGARRWPFSVSVVIAALNEGATIGDVVERTRAICPGAEVLVVDDASTDDTAARAEAAGARVIRRPYTLGQGAGVKTGSAPRPETSSSSSTATASTIPPTSRGCST